MDQKLRNLNMQKRLQFFVILTASVGFDRRIMNSNSEITKNTHM